MRIGVVGSCHMKRLRKLVHIVDKALMWVLQLLFDIGAINNHFPIIRTIEIAFLEQSSEKLSNGKGCVVPAGEHHCIEKIQQ